MSGTPNQPSDRARYLRAAKARIAAAECLLQGVTDDRAQVATYLVQVALECALKARLVQEADLCRRSLEEFLGKETYREYFRSGRGHDLRRLAGHACMTRALQSDNQLALQDADSLAYLAGPPYPLRYGETDVCEAQAEAVLCFAQRLIHALRILP